MLRKGFSLAAVLALAVVMVAVDASPAQLLRKGRRTRGSSDDAVITSPQSEIRQSGYFMPDDTDTKRTAPAYLDVRVPAAAEVMVETEKTTQTGSRRTFVSPPISSGRNYVYEIKAKWMENGQPVERTRKVNIHAGEQVTVDFVGMPTTTEPERRGRMGRRRG
jgi:uncharacterized protein (TIGR03000 family)